MRVPAAAALAMCAAFAGAACSADAASIRFHSSLVQGRAAGVQSSTLTTGTSARSASSAETPIPVAVSNVPAAAHRLSSERVLAIANRLPEMRAPAPRIPRLVRRCLPEGRVPVAGQLLHTGRQEGDRPRDHRRPRRARRRTVDRLPGRVDDGARLPGRVREARERVVHMAAAVRAVRAAVRQLPPAVLAAAPRPARAALVLGVARVLQPRPHLRVRAARIPAAAVPARAHARAAAPRRPPARGYPPATAPAAARTDAVARARRGLPARLSHRAQRHRLERHRRRLRGRHRRQQDRGWPEALRSLAGGQRTRRHLRAVQLRGLRPVRAGLRLERQVG